MFYLGYGPSSTHGNQSQRLWWWQWAMGMLFLEALTCRLPGTDGLWGMTPRTGDSIPALIPYRFFWGLSGKFLRHTIRISTGCRRRCLRELLSKVLAACAAPDELAWGKVGGIPIWRAWTEAERLRSGRPDTERETEHTFLSPVIY